MPRAIFELAKGIDKSGVHQGGEAGALFVGEAGVLAVCLWAREVNLLVRDVKVAAENHWLVVFELFEIIQKRPVPSQAVIQAPQFVLGVWRVDVDEVVGAVL